MLLNQAIKNRNGKKDKYGSLTNKKRFSKFFIVTALLKQSAIKLRAEREEWFRKGVERNEMNK